jgi:hypothetical protein
VKRREVQGAPLGFDDDVSKRCDGQAMIGLKVVQDAALGTVGENLVMEVVKDILGDGLDLEARLIENIVAAQKSPGVLAAHAIVQEAPFVGERLIDVGDFGQQHVVILEGDDMPGAGNPDAHLIALDLHFARGKDIKQLRMEWSTVKLKNQIRHAGSDEKQIHDRTQNLVLNLVVPQSLRL